LLALKDEVDDTRTNKAPLRLRQLQQTHAEVGLSAESWKAFRLDFTGDVDGIVAVAVKAIEGRIRALAGPAPGEAIVPAGAPPSTTSRLVDGAELSKQALSLLDKEVARLRALIGVDAENAKAFARLSEKISRDEAALAKLDRDIETASRAEERIKVLIQLRRDSYAAVFDGIIDEENELSALYEPLKARLEAEEGALRKLSFAIRRSIDVAAWAQQGEDLLDLRKTGPFKSRGTLLEAAKAELLPAWERGSSANVTEAMAKFRDAHESELIAHAQVDRGNAAAFREWGARIGQHFLGRKAAIHHPRAFGLATPGGPQERPRQPRCGPLERRRRKPESACVEECAIVD
jgi:hypothetical protein